MTDTTREKTTPWVSHWLIHGPSYLAAVALFVLMTMTFFDVVLRSTVNNPIESATELTRILMAIIVFSSLPIVTWRGQHISVDLLDRLFVGGLSRLRDIVVDGFCGVVLFWPAYRVWELAGRAHAYGDTTEYLQIPQFYMDYFIAVATLLTAVVLIVRALLTIFAPAFLRNQQ